MSIVTISPKYQIVIPKKVRQLLQLEPGQKVRVFAYKNRIEAIPIIPIQKLRGYLKGIDTTVERESNRL